MRSFLNHSTSEHVVSVSFNSNSLVFHAIIVCLRDPAAPTSTKTNLVMDLAVSELMTLLESQ